MHSRRSWLTVVGIAIGVYSVLVIAIIGRSGQELLNRELGRMGFNCITISASDKALNHLNAPQLDYLSSLPEVSVAAPLVFNVGQVATRGYVGDAVVCGIDKTTSQVVQIEMLYGRMFSPGELAAGSRVCIVDESLAKAFYKRSNIIGKELTVRLGSIEETFTVIGISGNSSNMLTNLVGEYLPSFVYLPYTTQMEVTGRTAIDQVFLQLDPGLDNEALGAEISDTLSRQAGYYNLYRHSNLALQKDKLNSIFEIVTIGLMIIGGISFLVSGLSIMTIMLSSVQERTREIGIKKAIGARQLDILGEFLRDALKLSLRGGLIGAGLALFTATITARFMKLSLVIPIGLTVTICLFSVIIGVIFGVYPACTAARMHPVEALRQEN